MSTQINRLINVQRSESSPTEPVTLAEAKAQCIVTYSDDDTLITSLITKARKSIENYCNISIVAQTVVMTADLYKEWELPYGPVTGIQSVQSRTSTQGSGPAVYSGLATGWGTDGTDFMTFIPGGANDFNPSIPFTGNFGYPPYGSRYKIQYTTGYTLGNPCPDDLKQAVLAQILFLYEKRGEQGDGICDQARVLADPYKRQLWL